MVNVYHDVESLTREGVIKHYAPMVKRIAHHLMGRLPSSIQVEDLLQAGMIGLLDAAKNFDNSKGASFETYASIRIRGSMLDEVRKNDWVPRSVHRNSRRIAEVIHELENDLGRDARDNEIAAALGVDTAEYHRMLQDKHSGNLFGYEDAGLTDDVMSNGYSASIPNPLEDISREDLQNYLSNVIANLSERERLVLSLYYDEELNLKEIGAVLNVSESRVCQIHSQAMHRLQSRMLDWKR